MRLQFKHQIFQADAEKAVVNVVADSGAKTSAEEIFKILAPYTHVKVI